MQRSLYDTKDVCQKYKLDHNANVFPTWLRGPHNWRRCTDLPDRPWGNPISTRGWYCTQCRTVEYDADTKQEAKP